MSWEKWQKDSMPDEGVVLVRSVSPYCRSYSIMRARIRRNGEQYWESAGELPLDGGEEDEDKEWLRLV